MQLRSCVAVAVAGRCSSDLIPSLGTSICQEYDPKKTKNNIKVPNTGKRVIFKLNLPEGLQLCGQSFLSNPSLPWGDNRGWGPHPRVLQDIPNNVN